MLRASKFTPCDASPKTKCNKCVWITVDTGDLTADGHDATRTDTFFIALNQESVTVNVNFILVFQTAHTIQGNICYLMAPKLMNKPVNTIMVQKRSGLSQRCKDEIVKILALNNKFKPTIIRTILENKFNVSLKEKERNQTNGCIARKRLLMEDAWEENTISGVAAFSNNNQQHEGLDNDDACAENFDVPPPLAGVEFHSHPTLCCDIFTTS